MLKRSFRRITRENLNYNLMKRKPVKLLVSLLIIMAVSCNEPETVVTDFVHPDGSVTRSIEMKSIDSKAEDRFRISDLQVPFDSTWVVKDSVEINNKGDSIWVRRGVKLFKNTEELNLAYKSDSGANKHISRRTEFKTRFKWFNTEYRFSEIIEKRLSFGYPVNKFLNSDELSYFYSPESEKEAKKAGPDSLKYRSCLLYTSPSPRDRTRSR